MYIYIRVYSTKKINEAFQWISRGHRFVSKVVYVRPNFQKKNQQPIDFPEIFGIPFPFQKKYYQNSGAKKVVFSVENSPAFTAQHRDGFRANDFRHFRPFFLRRFPRKSGPNTKVFRRLRGTGEKKEECECHSELRKKMEFSWA